MKRFLGFLVLILLIVIVIFGLWKLFGKRGTQSTAQHTATQETSRLGRAPAVDIDEAVKGIADDIKASPEFQQCAAQFLEGCVGTVINAKLAAGGDIALCDDFLTEAARTQCRAMQTIVKAATDDDLALCDTLSDDYKATCQQEVVVARAEKQKDITICEQQLTGDAVRNCIVRIAHRFAQDTKDVSWCDKIPDNPNGDGIARMEREMCKTDFEIFEVDRKDGISQQEEELLSDAAVDAEQS